MYLMKIDEVNHSIMNEVYLYASNLGHSSFKMAKLEKISFVKGDADYADFEGAALNDSNLFRTTFLGASFRQADLTNVNLSLTLLKDVDFANAILNKCKFSGASLFGAKGFETVKLEWIDVGGDEQPKKLYETDAIEWLLSEVRKPI